VLTGEQDLTGFEEEDEEGEDEDDDDDDEDDDESIEDEGEADAAALMVQRDEAERAAHAAEVRGPEGGGTLEAEEEEDGEKEEDVAQLLLNLDAPRRESRPDGAPLSTPTSMLTI
jgi:hypothetical protein